MKQMASETDDNSLLKLLIAAGVAVGAWMVWNHFRSEDLDKIEANNSFSDGDLNKLRQAGLKLGPRSS
jgi:hypothetical protein